MAKLDATLTEKVTRAIQEYYFAEEPSPTFVIVARDSLRMLPGGTRSFLAKVTIEVEAANGVMKKHTVYIRFRVTEKGKVVGSSIEHLPQP